VLLALVGVAGPTSAWAGDAPGTGDAAVADVAAVAAVADVAAVAAVADDGAPPGAAVTLDQLLSHADEHAPALGVARGTRASAEAARAGAGVWLPTNPEFTTTVGPRMGGGGVDVDVEVGVRQQLQVAGERDARLGFADRGVDVNDQAIAAARWLVHCDVHAWFQTALVERARARLATRVVEFQRDILRIVERRIAAGEAAPLSLRLARAEVAQAEQDLVAARQAALAARVRLAVLSGWSIEEPPDPRGEVVVQGQPLPLVRLRALATEHLPRLRVALARVREAEARVVLATREATPRPSVGVEYRRESDPTRTRVDDIVVGSVSIPVPVFQTGQGDRARAAADVTLARAELDALRTLIDGDIAQARVDVAAAAARTRAYGEDILPRFEENLALLGRSFALGEIDLLALATGRERFLRMQRDALDARRDYVVAVAALERAVGVDAVFDSAAPDGHDHGAPVETSR
jgi:cobalt-zinc-cadmium efflux system outer membrane protein